MKYTIERKQLIKLLKAVYKAGEYKLPFKRVMQAWDESTEK
jgi:hypothetical protein